VFKRNSDDLNKNFEALKNKFEMETLKQIEIFEEKLASVEKNVKNQIPKEMSRIDSGQRTMSDTIHKQVETANQEIEKINVKVAQTVSKSDLHARMENLETRIQMKFDSALQKNTEGQNVLKDWLDKLSQKSEENEKHFETLKSLFPENGIDLTQVVSKSELEALTKKLSDDSETARTQLSALEELFKALETKFNDNSANLKDEMSVFKDETSQKLKGFEEMNSSLVELGKKVDTSKGNIQEMIQILETLNSTGKKMDTRLTEAEKWVSELKTNLNSVISESDVIKLNLKNYQVTVLPWNLIVVVPQGSAMTR